MHVLIFGMSLIPVFVSDRPLVLMPVQIAFIQLIIDPACSIVFESEQIDPRVMQRPPRGLDDPMFGRGVLALAALQGLSVLIAVLGVYLWAMADDRTDEAVRSLTFATLVIANLALILVNRSWRLSIWRTFRERRNPTLKWILGLAGILLVALLSVGELREASDFGPMRALDWLLALAAGALGVTWFEIWKLRARD